MLVSAAANDDVRRMVDDTRATEETVDGCEKSRFRCAIGSYSTARPGTCQLRILLLLRIVSHCFALHRIASHRGLVGVSGDRGSAGYLNQAIGILQRRCSWFFGIRFAAECVEQGVDVEGPGPLCWCCNVYYQWIFPTIQYPGRSISTN